MNIVLAEVQSLNINLSESSVDSAPESGEFSDILRSSLQDNSDDGQVVDNKQLNPGSLEFGDNETAATALSWLAYLSSAEVTVTTDSEALTTAIVSPEQTAPSVQLVAMNSVMPADTDQLKFRSTVGEPLPVAGKVLPPGSNTDVKLPLADFRQVSRSSDIPISPSVDSGAEPDSRDTHKLGLMRGDSQLLAQGIDQNTTAIFDKLAESVSPKALENTSGLQVLPDTALARQLVISPVGAMTNFQAGHSLTAIPEPLSIARPDSPAEWSQGLGDRVSWMINQKLNSASIRLDPPSLGKLEIHVKVTDEATNITINTQTGQTRDLIDNASMRLRDILQEAGYQNVNVDVGQGNQSKPGERQVADAAGQLEEGVEQSQDFNEHKASETGLFSHSDSLVDYFA